MSSSMQPSSRRARARRGARALRAREQHVVAFGESAARGRRDRGACSIAMRSARSAARDARVGSSLEWRRGGSGATRHGSRSRARDRIAQQPGPLAERRHRDVPRRREHAEPRDHVVLVELAACRRRERDLDRDGRDRSARPRAARAFVTRGAQLAGEHCARRAISGASSRAQIRRTRDSARSPRRAAVAVVGERARRVAASSSATARRSSSLRRRRPCGRWLAARRRVQITPRTRAATTARCLRARRARRALAARATADRDCARRPTSTCGRRCSGASTRGRRRRERRAASDARSAAPARSTSRSRRRSRLLAHLHELDVGAVRRADRVLGAQREHRGMLCLDLARQIVARVARDAGRRAGSAARATSAAPAAACTP